MSTPIATPVATPMPAEPLQAGWRDGLTVINLRGDPGSPAFLAGSREALGVDLPTAACTTSRGENLQVIWAGPDDWFVIGPVGQADVLSRALRTRLAGQAVAITDVSSGYTVLQLSGPQAREVLARGCPLDLHPRAFGVGQSAGTHFFKTSVWLWQVDNAPGYELLVRRSFMGYVALMLERCTLECGLSDLR